MTTPTDAHDTPAVAAASVVPPSVWLLGVITATVWGTRIRNIVGDDELVEEELAARLVLAVLMTALGVALLAVAGQALVRRVRTPAVEYLGRSLAATTVVVWAWRGAVIVMQTRWSLGFKLVHTALAVGSISLAVLARRALRQQTAGTAP